MSEAPTPPKSPKPPEYVPQPVWLQQSPIELGKSYHVPELPALTFNYGQTVSGTFKDDDNFHISPADRSKATITFDGIVCPLVRLHFHAPSEHLVDGVATDFEAHLVHEVPVSSLSPKPFSVAIGIFFNKPKAVSGDSPKTASKRLSLQESVINQFFKKAGKADSTYTFKPEIFLPKNSHDLYHYAGSLTTDQFEESVTWFVLASHGTLDTKFEIRAQDKTHHTPRKVQPLNRRFVLRNFE